MKEHFTIQVIENPTIEQALFIREGLQNYNPVT